MHRNEGIVLLAAQGGNWRKTRSGGRELQAVLDFSEMGRMNCGWQRSISPQTVMSSYYQHSTAPPHAWRPVLGIALDVNVSSAEPAVVMKLTRLTPRCKGYRRLPQTGGSDADKEELAPITGTN